MTKVKIWKNGQTPRSKVRGSSSWYQMKGLVRRNTYVKYKSPNTDQSKVLTKVKVWKRRLNSGQRVEVMV
jgi:hypothetical protein